MSRGCPHPSIPNTEAASKAARSQSRAPVPLPAETTAPTSCVLHLIAAARQTLRLGLCPLSTPAAQGKQTAPPVRPLATMATWLARPYWEVPQAPALQSLWAQLHALSAITAGGERAETTNKKHVQLG